MVNVEEKSGKLLDLDGMFGEDVSIRIDSQLLIDGNFINLDR